ncbi:MAG: family 1 glycosylhydrolase [Anaerolineales bacterium]|nr:family 1 glycosylhydrolase [Anaerolineales bacterium]
MAEATFNFPRNFVWGTASAAHQNEGNNTNNNWYAYEQTEGNIIHGHKSGLAADWWGGRWREDFDRAAEAGQKAHRLSVEWSRIQPTPDRWDEDALDHYREMVRGLRERGMMPMVTLHHFTDPLWVYERGGWLNDISDQFAAFTEKVVGALKEYVTQWVTINEPNVYAAQGYMLGEFPPGRKNELLNSFKVMTNLVRGHAAAYHTLHRIQQNAQVGMAHQYRGILPARKWLPLDVGLAGLLSGLFNDFFPRAASTGVLKFPGWRYKIHHAKGTQDFFGVNYYTREYVKFHPLSLLGKRFFDPEAELSDTGFIANEPQGFYDALKWANGFRLPIIVTENGVEDADDHMRPRYLAQHIHQMWRAVNFNWPIKGYYYWSLVDNFEWDRGWTQRYGLWELDVETQARRKRPSADFYAEICKTNSLSSEMVARYAPKIFPQMFPNE